MVTKKDHKSYGTAANKGNNKITELRTILQIKKILLICSLNVYSKQGLQDKFYKADKTALDRLWGPIIPLVNFHEYVIPCAAECLDNISFIQTSNKHNLEV